MKLRKDYAWWMTVQWGRRSKFLKSKEWWYTYTWKVAQTRSPPPNTVRLPAISTLKQNFVNRSWCGQKVTIGTENIYIIEGVAMQVHRNSSMLGFRMTRPVIKEKSLWKEVRLRIHGPFVPCRLRAVADATHYSSLAIHWLTTAYLQQN